MPLVMPPPWVHAAPPSPLATEPPASADPPPPATVWCDGPTGYDEPCGAYTARGLTTERRWALEDWGWRCPRCQAVAQVRAARRREKPRIVERAPEVRARVEEYAGAVLPRVNGGAR